MPDRTALAAPPATPPATRDRAGRRGAAFLLAVVLALFLGYWIGRSPAPASAPVAAPPHSHGAPGADVGGYAVSENGYTLVTDTTAFAAGVAAPLRFRIVGPDRAPLTAFASSGGVALHLVVVRRDLTGYQHLHPTMASDGTWSVSLTLPAPGSYRAFADFTTADATALTLGVDLTVAGAYTPVGLPPTSRESTVDGYTVTYDGSPTAAATVPVLFRVVHSGQPADLQRYLGAYGHLVVVRDGDLAFLHVHPETELAGGAIRFWLSTPSPGRYRAFLDFEVGGVVRTAQYTVQVA
jgi:hypothetical protein